MKTDVNMLRLIIKATLVDGLGNRAICKKYGVHSSTVSRYVKALDSTVLTWDELSKLDDEEFLIALKPKAVKKFVQPDFEAIYNTKLSHKKMTLEKAFDFCYYNQELPKGYNFYATSHLYDQFSIWFTENHGKAKISSVPCNPGDFLEIDFVGDRLHWIEIGTGKKHEGRVFVGAYKYSGLIYAHVFEDETTRLWQEGTIGAFERYGVPKALSMDNAKALVDKPDKYLADLRAGMHQLCSHYQVCPNVCKVRTPKQKNVAEYSANLIETHSIVELEGAMGYLVAKDLDEVNKKLEQKITELNLKPFVEQGRGSRQIIFDQYEKSQLRAAPVVPFEVSDWKLLKVDKNGWVKIDGNKRYLVDYHQRNKTVICRLTNTHVYFYAQHDHKACGDYKRCYQFGYQCLKNEKLLHPTERALTLGLSETVQSFKEQGYALENIVNYLTAVFNLKLPQITNYKRVMGLLGLCNKYGVKIVDEACASAVTNSSIDDYYYIKQHVHDAINRINAIRKQKSAQAATPAKAKKSPSSEGKNLRGADAFEG